MSLQRRLASAALDLQRRIGASMPRGYRLMLGFMRLATDSVAQAFGLLVYAEFLRAGVKNMPDIHGTPAAEFDTSSPRLMNKLPHGYGATLGDRAAKMLYALGFKTPDVHDTLSDYQLELLHGHSFSGSYNVHQAESYVLDGLKKFALNKMAKNKRRQKYHGPGGHEDDEGHFVQIDPEDPNAFKKMDQAMTAEQLHKFMEFLKTIHPDLPQFFHMTSEGLTAKDIINKGLLPGFAKQFTGDLAMKSFDNWKRKKVTPAIERYLKLHDDE
jgi:hypothetical protein